MFSLGKVRALAGLIAVAALVLPGGPAKPQTPSAAFDIKGSGTVAQGEPLRYTLTVRNSSEDTESVAALVELVHEKTRRRIGIEGWRTKIPPGSQDRLVTSVVPAQWFEELGRYRLQVKDLGASPVRFEVKRSPIPVPRFQDITDAAGLGDAFVSFTSECGRWAAGAAWGDIEDDGDLDLYLPRRARTGDDGAARLWINQSGQFVDEAAGRGVAVVNGIGAVFGDVDNDGDQDLYANSDGPDHLFINDGNGFFSDVTDEAGVNVPGSSQSATWLDYDTDGNLDLYVTNHRTCAAETSQADRLLHNNGDGTFTDTSDLLTASGSTTGAGFQTAWFDYDNDGDLDIYLANDYWGPRPEPNVLWSNESSDGGSRFANVSDSSNAGVIMNSMGIGVGDYDRDLDFDLAVSDIRAAALLQNDQGGFRNRASYARIARDQHDAETIAITWSVAFNDLNNDGWEDLYLAAGRLSEGAYQPNELFTNARDGRFLDHSAPSHADHDGTSKGVAYADFDRDGRMDMYVVNQEGSPILYRNVTPAGRRHWLEIDTVGTASNRDGCGARLVAHVGKARLLRQVFCGGTSLATGSDSVVHIGLGKRDSIDKLVVMWPSGIQQILENVKADRLIQITESSG